MRWLPTRSLLAAGSALALTVALGGSAVSAPISGPGDVDVGVNVSVWDSTVPLDLVHGIIPIGGAGQVNGEFTTTERLGIQIGLRAQNRFLGTLTATPNKNGKVGIYEAAVSSVAGPASWNYDWHVDLRDSRGVAKGTTLADYDLTLETDIAPALFGFPEPVDLTFGGLVPGNTVLYQSSQNPDFGNTVFDATQSGTYHLRLVLTPKTFNGPPLAVAIRVIVS